MLGKRSELRINGKKKNVEKNFYSFLHKNVHKDEEWERKKEINDENNKAMISE